MDLKELTKQAVRAALDAGELIRSFQDREVEVLHKEGGDTYASQVVTEVDRKAQDAILRVLGPVSEEFHLAVLTEENEDDGSRFEKEFFWCIDPMDGTLPFIRKEPGYSVSIALVAKDGSPLIGVVYDPVHDVLWQATKGEGILRNGEPWTLNASSKELTFTYDRSFVDRPERDRVLQELETYAQSVGLKKLVTIQFGGAVINACHALENGPGCHFKLAKPQEGGGSLWDYAATACLYEEAGAVVSDVHGGPLDLNRPDSTFMNHRGAIYATDQDLAERIKGILAQTG
jgi:fructose-1,6-bisphosphatase/inositol monophosphatase family enzyme